MAEFVGLLMIVLALGIGCWRLFKGRKVPGSGLALLVLACFIGVALVLNKRVSELSFGKLATLKAAVTQAQSDAEQIAAVRQRVEAQAATLDLVAKESADAKRLLGELRKENKIADTKLRALEEKTSDFTQLPDGRVITGGLIVGRASILINSVTNLVARFSAGNFEEAFGVAQNCIQRYEDTAAATKGVSASIAFGVAQNCIQRYEDTAAATKGVSASIGDVSLSESGAAIMYGAGAESALRLGRNEIALKWLRIAVTHDPSPERKALVAVALISAGQEKEARTYIEETLAKADTNAAAFRAVLERSGVLKSQ